MMTSSCFKIALFSNYLNEHQLPLCLAWHDMPGVEFTFVALDEFGGNTGRRNMNNEYEFVLREYESDSAKEEANFHIQNDDIVIFGDMGGKEQYVLARNLIEKISFRATERPLRRGYWWAFMPPKMMRMYKWFLQYKNKKMYILCIGAYTSYDLKFCSWPLDKCFVWSYFPKVEEFGNRSYLSSEFISIFWAARLIDLKRPLAPLQLAKRLKADGYSFRLTIAGNGPMRDEMLSYIEQSNLSDVVLMPGALSGVNTKKLMHQSDIYLTTSSCKEGWGITVSEAMLEGCCVVASASIGSAPVLIEDGVNGLLYDDLSGECSRDSLYLKVKTLLDNPKLIVTFGSNAKQTMEGTWSAELAAKRLLELAQCVQNDKPTPFGEGPCSYAKPIKNGWFRKKN